MKNMRRLRRAASPWLRSPKVRLLAQVVLMVACLVPIGHQLAAAWGGVGGLLQHVKIVALAASVAALVLSSLFLPTAMAAFTRGMPHRISYRDSALAYFGSQPMKYLPGAFWILPGRIVLLRRLGRDSGVSSAALLFEMTTQVLSASVVVVLLGLAGHLSGWYLHAAWLVFVGSIVASLCLLLGPVVAPHLPRRLSSLRTTLASLAEVPFGVRLRNLVLATALYAAMWAVLGVSFYALVVVGNPRLDFKLLLTAVSVSTLSWLAGFLTPFSPGGLGVREGVIVLLLSPLMAAPQAVMIALLSRVLALVAELGFAGVAALPLRAARGGAAA